MLLIDVGNNRIKSAVWSNDHWLLPRTIEYKKNNLPHAFDEIIQGISPQSVYISCVVDAMKEPLSSWFVSQWVVEPRFIVAVPDMCGVRNAYANTAALGVDRWLAMVAAFNKFKSSVCVIDCGTAVTVDVVAANGQHQGGLIMPGLQLMHDSLFTSTSKLKTGPGDLVELATNTQDAVTSGCHQLLAYGLDVICQKQQAIYADMQIVITGGDGKIIARMMTAKNVFISTLVLDGLLIAAGQEC